MGSDEIKFGIWPGFGRMSGGGGISGSFGCLVGWVSFEKRVGHIRLVQNYSFSSGAFDIPHELRKGSTFLDQT